MIVCADQQITTAFIRTTRAATEAYRLTPPMWYGIIAGTYNIPTIPFAQALVHPISLCPLGNEDFPQMTAKDMKTDSSR